MLEALATFGAALEAKKVRKKKLKMKVRIDKGIFFFLVPCVSMSSHEHKNLVRYLHWSGLGFISVLKS